MGRYISIPTECDAFSIEAVRGDDKHPNDVAIILANPLGAKMVIHLTKRMVTKHFPRVGDFYVIDSADDYRKIVPREVFESRWRPINSDPPVLGSPGTP